MIADQIHVARERLRSDRPGALAALNELFRGGAPPSPPLAGRYAGELVALDVAPGLTQLAAALAAAWLPWQGKGFDPQRARGYNIFTRDSFPLANLFWPLYRRYVGDGPHTYRAFFFRTWAGPGLMDPDRQVLKIDYDLPENPPRTIRRVLDELVQIEDGLYLGKAHLRWWWGSWQTVAYFSLAAASDGRVG
ncbi:MAG TPA: hypothetical protein VNL77_10310 [Roseiflexaceae bacterium]|nr:hypothetical protein [Roseiflexaceae bacterium]